MDWTAAANNFDLTRMLLDDFRVPSPSDFERHEAHLLTGGLVPTRFKEKSPYFDMFCLPGGQDWLERAHHLSTEIAGQRCGSVDGVDVPTTDWRNIIMLAISNKCLTTDFLTAWSTMESFYGRLVELDALNSAAHQRYRTNVASGSATNNLARKCWFANWLYKRDAISNKSRRDHETNEIHQLCLDITVGNRNCPINPEFYDKSWFRRLLSPSIKNQKKQRIHDNDLDLIDAVCFISDCEIRDLLAHPFLKPQVLPPLDPSEFPRLSTEP